jgi:hypothetical protein
MHKYISYMNGYPCVWTLRLLSTRVCATFLDARAEDSEELRKRLDKH